MQRIAAPFHGRWRVWRRKIGRFMGIQTMCHKHSLWIEKPLPDAHRGIFGNSGDSAAKSISIFPDGTLFSRRSARSWPAGDRGTAMAAKKDGDGDHPRRPLRSSRRRWGRDGRWLDGWAASAGGAIRVTVAAAAAGRVPDRERVSGPFQSVAAQAEARPHNMAEGSGKSPDLSAHTVSSEGALGWQRAITGPPQGHWRKRPLGLEDPDRSTIMASGGDEKIEDNSVGQTHLEVVVEPSDACLSNGSNSDSGPPRAPSMRHPLSHREDLADSRRRPPPQVVAAHSGI